jgi:protein-disulfide isomerase
MLVLGRRNLLLSATALSVLAACNGASSGGGVSEDDVVLGQANAPVTLIEYASATCPHCAHFHETVWEQLKTNYIDTGKVRFVYREYPTPPAAVAVAAFQVARCGGANPDQYFARLGEVYRQQQAMFASGTIEGIRQKLIEIGTNSNLSEAQVLQCVGDETGAERARRIQEASREFNITGTPTLILNGRKLETADAVTWEGLSREIEAALAQ